MPVGTGWPALTTIDEPTSTLNGVLNMLMMRTSAALPSLVNTRLCGPLVFCPAGIGGIVPISVASADGLSTVTRSTDCFRLTSSDRSQVLGVLALQVPVQPAMQTELTALHIEGFAWHGCVVNRSASVCCTSQPLASIVNFLSGNVRSKLVTSEL